MNEDERFIQMDAGNCFTVGLAIHTDLQSNNSSDEAAELSQVRSIHKNGKVDDSLPNRYSHFSFNTLETTVVREKPRVVNSELTRSMMTTTLSTKQSIPFTPLLERKYPLKEEKNGKEGDDICYASRAARAAALEKQFQQFRK